jgi:hypothetical protein
MDRVAHIGYGPFGPRRKTGFSDWVHAFPSCDSYEENCWTPSIARVQTRRAAAGRITKTHAIGLEILCIHGERRG